MMPPGFPRRAVGAIGLKSGKKRIGRRCLVSSREASDSPAPFPFRAAVEMLANSVATMKAYTGER